MANLPRFLPLIAVAIGGVIAMKAVSSIEGVPEFLKQATAMAENAPKPAAKPAKGKKSSAQEGAADANPDLSASDAKTLLGEASGSSNQASITELNNADPNAALKGAESKALSAGDVAEEAAAQALAQKPAPVCATSANDLAKQAGISPSELNILQSLSTRRQQLDARESQINMQAQLVEAADAKLDSRIKQMQTLKAQMEAMLAQASKTGDEDVARMVKVYESMKPKDAGAVLANMSDEVRLPIAAKMKEAKLAAVLGTMSPSAAQDLTEKLTQRMKRVNDLGQKLNQLSPNGANGAPQTPQPAKANAPAKPQTPPNAAKK